MIFRLIPGRWYCCVGMIFRYWDSIDFSVLVDLFSMALSVEMAIYLIVLNLRPITQISRRKR